MPETIDAQALAARLAAREERVRLLEEENRWLKAQLFGRSSEKTPVEDISPDQAWFFNEAEALAKAAEAAPQSITIAAMSATSAGAKSFQQNFPVSRSCTISLRARRSVPRTACRSSHQRFTQSYPFPSPIAGDPFNDAPMPQSR